jgi:hypothetical protein
LVATGIKPHGDDGSVAVEMLDRHYQPVEGFGREDCLPATQDAMSARISWKNHADLSALKNKTIRLKFYITNAGLYSFAIK